MFPCPLQPRSVTSASLPNRRGQRPRLQHHLLPSQTTGVSAPGYNVFLPPVAEGGDLGLLLFKPTGVYNASVAEGGDLGLSSQTSGVGAPGYNI
jgi:hypothetical protein